MAYSFASASSQYISANSSPISAYPLTIAAFGNIESTGNNTKNLVTLDQSGVSLRSILLQTYTSSGQKLSAGVFGANATAGGADGTTAITTSQYFHGCGVYTNDSSRAVWLNGSQDATNTKLLTFPSVSRLAVGVYRNNTVLDGLLDGKVSEVAMWNVALTDAEISSLSKGFKPTRIRPQSLVFYAPLLRNLQDIKGALALTNNNSATVADHPRVY